VRNTWTIRRSCAAGCERSTFYLRAGGEHLDIEHIRIDVQTDIGDVLKMLAANKPHDFGNLAFGIIAGEKRRDRPIVRVDLAGIVALSWARSPQRPQRCRGAQSFYLDIPQ